jgi:FkbH-like protein
MSTFVFRNYTVEYLFDDSHVFSGYGEINLPATTFDQYVIFYQCNPSFTPEDQIVEIEEIKSKIDFLLAHLDSEKRVVIFTLHQVFNKEWQLKSGELGNSYSGFNMIYLKQIQEKKRNVKIIDINSFFQSEWQIPSVEWRFFFTSQLVINPKLGKSFLHWYNNRINAFNLSRKKCIVLDCDNTLWGGIVGEDGVHGVKLGDGYPGVCYKSFQKLLAMIAGKGVILAICSKNNFSDVEEIWKSNINNIINNSYISSYRINWEDKATNIKAIAEELNIGLDSIVFIEDNPMERGLVKKFLPEVEVPEFPEKPYYLIDFFWKIYNEYFITYELSKEDLRKTEQYKANLVRRESKNNFSNLDEYFKSLEIQIDIYSADETNIPRISQLTQKTNQFNVTTKRYKEEEIRSFIKDKSKVFCAGVKDKFGDNGITIAGILKYLNPEEVFIDSYLLSCRILGRNIEKVLLTEVMNSLRKQGISRIKAKFIPTKKNQLASNFFADVGFKVDEISKEGTKYYSLELDNDILINGYYKIVHH